MLGGFDSQKTNLLRGGAIMKSCKIWKVLTFSIGLALFAALFLPSIPLAMDKPGGFPNRPITIP